MTQPARPKPIARPVASNRALWGRPAPGLVWLVAVADLAVAGLAYIGAFVARTYVALPGTEHLIPPTRILDVTNPLVLLTVTQLGVLYAFGLYDLRWAAGRWGAASRVAVALGVQLLMLGAWIFFRGDAMFPRSVLVVFWLFNTLGVAGVRAGLHRRLQRAAAVRVLLVGTAADVPTFVANLGHLHRTARVEVVGLVGIQDGNAPTQSAVPWLGHMDALPDILRRIQVDETILLSSTSWKDHLVARLAHMPTETGRVLVVPSVYDVLVGRITSLRLHDIPLVEVLRQPVDDPAFLIKGITDRLVAGALLLLGLPLLGLVAGLVKLSSPGPILYRQRRVGRHEEEFTLYKFRTMVADAEAATGPILACPADDRITGVGRFLRAMRLDELPQLVNVLTGAMSLVGPRPERPAFVAEYRDSIPGYVERFQVRPGLTGLAQINGGYHTSPEMKLKYDLSYIYNYSLWLDLRVLAETVKVVLTRQGV